MLVAHFIEFHIMGDLEVVHVGADPAGDAGEAVASGAADFNSLAILGGIHEKFGGLDESALAAELVEQVVDAGDLLDGIRGSGLLSRKVVSVMNMGSAGRGTRNVSSNSMRLTCVYGKTSRYSSGSTRLSSVRGREACF
jgi:hypothetical protein